MPPPPTTLCLFVHLGDSAILPQFALHSFRICLSQKQHNSLLRLCTPEIKALCRPSLPTINVEEPYFEAPRTEEERKR